MAISDGFIVICWMIVAYLVLLLFLRRAKYSYQDLRKMT
jgi:ABC-type Co2+ transport system permease subunit